MVCTHLSTSHRHVWNLPIFILSTKPHHPHISSTCQIRPHRFYLAIPPVSVRLVSQRRQDRKRLILTYAYHEPRTTQVDARGKAQRRNSVSDAFRGMDLSIMLQRRSERASTIIIHSWPQVYPLDHTLSSDDDDTCQRAGCQYVKLLVIHFKLLSFLSISSNYPLLINFDDQNKKRENTCALSICLTSSMLFRARKKTASSSFVANSNARKKGIAISRP